MDVRLICASIKFTYLLACFERCIIYLLFRAFEMKTATGNFTNEVAAKHNNESISLPELLEFRCTAHIMQSN